MGSSTAETSDTIRAVRPRRVSRHCWRSTVGRDAWTPGDSTRSPSHCGPISTIRSPTSRHCGNYSVIGGTDGPTLPGLTAEIVIRAFASSGFRCRGPGLDRPRRCWDCTWSSGVLGYHVMIAGRDPEAIEVVVGKLLHDGADLTMSVAEEFLSFLITVPYIGAQPQKVRNWLAKTIERGGSVSIGPARFELMTSDQDWRLNRSADENHMALGYTPRRS